MNFSKILNFLNDVLDDDKIEFFLEEDERSLIIENKLGKILFNTEDKEIELDLEKQASKVIINAYRLNSDAERKTLSLLFDNVLKIVEKLKKEKEEYLLENLMEFKKNFNKAKL